MPGFDGTGPRGMGPMTGGGRGLCSPWGRGAGFRRGIAPLYPEVPYAPYRGFGAMPYGATAPWEAPFAPQMTREQELGLLKQDAQATREQLEQIEARINDLTAGE